MLKYSAFIIALALVLAVAPDALASAGAGLPFESWLQSLESSATGPVAFSISGIGIVVCGFTLVLGGDLPGFFRQFIFLVLVMAVILCAANIKAQFFGKGSLISLSYETTKVV